MGICSKDKAEPHPPQPIIEGRMGSNQAGDLLIGLFEIEVTEYEGVIYIFWRCTESSECMCDGRTESRT